MNQHLERICKLSREYKQKRPHKRTTKKFNITLYFPDEVSLTKFNDFANSQNTTINRLIRLFILDIVNGFVEYALILLKYHNEYKKTNYHNFLKPKGISFYDKKIRRKLNRFCKFHKITMNEIIVSFIWDAINQQ
jgi:hypothetical protein